MSNPIDELVEKILRLNARQMVELNRRLKGRGGPGLGGLREPIRPTPPKLPPTMSDSEDRSVRGRTLS